MKIFSDPVHGMLSAWIRKALIIGLVIPMVHYIDY
jgi:hypothetical protein